MVLDCYSTCFLWIGLRACDSEKKNSYKKVEEYIKDKKDGRDVNHVQIVQVDPVSEPINFRTHFPEWEEEYSQKWLDLDPYEAELARIAKEKHDAADAKWGNHEEKVYEVAETGNFFDLKVLQTSIPEGCNPAAKENYLSDAQFEEVFKMNK